MRDHAAASKHVQLVTPRFRTLLIACVIAAASACTEPPPNFGLAAPPGLVSTWHTPDTSITNFCTAIAWNTCVAWPITDDQQLNAGNGEYGPLAFIAPSPALAGNTSSSGFVNETVVAVVHVRAPLGTTLPPSYEALELAPQWNCVYLRSDGGWKARVTPAAEGGDPCPATPSGGGELKVLPVSTVGYDAPGDVPPVARFHQGIRPTHEQPHFGVKCGNMWCMMLPLNGDTLPVPHKGLVPAERRWLVRGWHDAQYLAVPAASGGLELSRQVVGTAAPGPAAAFESEALFENGLVHAVTVHFRNAPGHSKYKDNWKFRRGENEVWIAKDPSSDRWAGRIRVNALGCGTFPGLPYCYKDLHVGKASDNGQALAPTARFRWDENDEGLWVRCADGCCKVSGT